MAKLKKRKMVIYDYTVKYCNTQSTGTLTRYNRIKSHEEKEELVKMILESKNLDNGIVEFRLI